MEKGMGKGMFMAPPPPVQPQGMGKGKGTGAASWNFSELGSLYGAPPAAPPSVSAGPRIMGGTMPQARPSGRPGRAYMDPQNPGVLFLTNRSATASNRS